MPRFIIEKLISAKDIKEALEKEQEATITDVKYFSKKFPVKDEYDDEIEEKQSCIGFFVSNDEDIDNITCKK